LLIPSMLITIVIDTNITYIQPKITIDHR